MKSSIKIEKGLSIRKKRGVWHLRWYIGGKQSEYSLRTSSKDEAIVLARRAYNEYLTNQYSPQVGRHVKRITIRGGLQPLQDQEDALHPIRKGQPLRPQEMR